MNPAYRRALPLPAPGTETFFLWGPRQTGKSTLLRETYGDGHWVDLLKAYAFRRYLTRPEALREELEAEPPGKRRQVVIDEIQKLPALLDAYVADYLKEEIAAEGLVRNLPVFSDFLDVAALSDGEIVTFSHVARECGVSSHTTKNHFQILEDTLLARWLPAYRKRPKRRVIGAAKFYLVDVGVANRLAKRGEPLPGSELYGKAFESWVFRELAAYVSYPDVDAALAYWRLASGIEVDFILGDMQVAIEAKSSERTTRDHLKGLRSLVEDHPRVGRRIVVCREPRARKTDDGIEILPVATFVKRLWAGELVA